MEHEANRAISFLDVAVTRTDNNLISTTVYKKPTHTDRYLHFDSHHPKHQKLAVARTLYNRSVTHIANPTERQRYNKEVRHTLLLNGFPRKYSCLQQRKDNPSSQSQFKSFICLPYIRGITDKIQRVVNKIGIRVAMKPYNTIGRFLPSLKDPLKDHEKSCLVYQVPCLDCDSIYIGQTKRDLKSRLDEHKRAIKNQLPQNSALCEHSMIFDHKIDWTSSTILKIEHDYTKLLFSESWFINQKQHVINRNDGKTLPSVYKKLL